MKKLIFIFFAALIASSFPVLAQVTTEFGDITVTKADYTDISEMPNVNIIPDSFLVEIPISSDQKDLDDGYVLIPLGFEFDFNGETFTEIYVNVNGFATFGRVTNGRVTPPPYLTEMVRKPINAFFEDDDSYPVNVIAPFWGDHYYRDEEDSFRDYVQSEMAYLLEEDANGDHVLTIQWKNLNINYLLDDEKIKSSVASFQLKIYESTKLYSRQGDIEFCYGQIGGNDMVEDTRVITKGAAIGLKGYKQAQGDGADYLNGLSWDVDRTTTNVIMDASENMDMSDAWTPSGGTNFRIRFEAYGKSKEADWWGDGDVDFSKVEGGRHANLNDGTDKTQNRWVTANDARIIMESIATEVPLEPTIERAAFHGDVTHDGRYFYNSLGEKVNITWVSEEYDQDLDNDETKEISNPKQQIYFEVTAYDAATILKYLSGRITMLPWLIDMEQDGYKVVNNEDANNIVLGDAKVISENLVQFPVYLNGNIDGAVAFDFKVNGIVENVVKNDDLNVLTDFADRKVVVAGDVNINAETPVCYVNVRTNNSVIECTDILFNDENTNDVVLKVASENVNNAVNVTPNPATARATFNINVIENAYYNVALFDITGRKVMNLHAGELSTGNNTIDFDVTSLNAGVYFVKAEGNNTVQTSRVVVK